MASVAARSPGGYRRAIIRHHDFVAAVTVPVDQGVMAAVGGHDLSRPRPARPRPIADCYPGVDIDIHEDLRPGGDGTMRPTLMDSNGSRFQRTLPAVEQARLSAPGQ